MTPVKDFAASQYTRSPFMFKRLSYVKSIISEDLKKIKGDKFKKIATIVSIYCIMFKAFFTWNWIMHLCRQGMSSRQPRPFIQF